MKNFSQLSTIEQKKAIDFCLNGIILNAVESSSADDVVLPVLGNDELECLFGDLIEDARKEADELATPWFFSEILFEKVSEENELMNALKTLAASIAATAYYRDENDTVINMKELV